MTRNVSFYHSFIHQSEMTVRVLFRGQNTIFSGLFVRLCNSYENTFSQPLGIKPRTSSNAPKWTGPFLLSIWNIPRQILGRIVFAAQNFLFLVSFALEVSLGKSCRCHCGYIRFTWLCKKARDTMTSIPWSFCIREEVAKYVKSFFHTLGLKLG